MKITEEERKRAIKELKDSKGKKSWKNRIVQASESGLTVEEIIRHGQFLESTVKFYLEIKE